MIGWIAYVRDVEKFKNIRKISVGRKEERHILGDLGGGGQSNNHNIKVGLKENV
jgi:hypothetical protein